MEAAARSAMMFSTDTLMGHGSAAEHLTVNTTSHQHSLAGSALADPGSSLAPAAWVPSATGPGPVDSVGSAPSAAGAPPSSSSSQRSRAVKCRAVVKRPVPGTFSTVVSLVTLKAPAKQVAEQLAALLSEQGLRGALAMLVLKICFTVRGRCPNWPMPPSQLDDRHTRDEAHTACCLT